MLGKDRPGFTLSDLPAGRFSEELGRLPPAARGRALERLRAFSFPPEDVRSLNVDRNGDVLYACDASHDHAAPAAAVKTVSSGTPEAAPVPISPFPPSLIFHSRPGSGNVIFLDFDGHNVSSTIWNNSLGRSVIPARPFSLDSTDSTFSDTEQEAVKRIWQRVAEDYAPYDVDVTTEQPVAFNKRVIRVLITRSTDADGNANPYPASGGVSYVGYFANPFYDYYAPSWVYINNLDFNEGNIAEASSHEAAHFIGLSHDGQTGGNEYYAGHGTGETSWAPIMGKSYGRSVTQWSKGEYLNANNTQDDDAILSAKLGYRPDDHGNTPASATPLTLISNMYIVSSTPETDPDNTQPANKGVITASDTGDLWQFSTGPGDVSLTINPWVSPGNTRGNNLDIKATLLDSNGTAIASTDPTNRTGIVLQTALDPGIYYVRIERSSMGSPKLPSPDGYTDYGSAGQYFISGTVASTAVGAPVDPSSLTVNLEPAEAAGAAWRVPELNTNWLSSGTTVTDIPADSYTIEFLPLAGWTAPSGTVITVDPGTWSSNTFAYAPVTTVEYGIPYWWLTGNGFTNSPETEVNSIGANGIPVWQSYVAGIDPNDPASSFTLDVTDTTAGDSIVLNWHSVPGRVYSIFCSVEPGLPPQPVPDAQNMAWPRASYTNQPGPGACLILSIQVELADP